MQLTLKNYAIEEFTIVTCLAYDDWEIPFRFHNKETSAQQFVADLTNSRGIDKECSQAVETLLRQGRKYGLGGCIATQRIAYLNTSALQQLHTYFVA